MRNPRGVYKALLKLYPTGYRSAFGDEMLQTFIDHYRDVEEAEGGVVISFWLSVVTDEMRNIAAQHRKSLMEADTFLEVTAPKLAIAAVLLIPLYAALYAVLVKVALSLPHPPLSGLAVAIALATLVLLPGLMSIATSYALASVLIEVLHRGGRMVAGKP